MKTNIPFKTFTWYIICSNHNASHTHGCPLGEADYLTHWNPRSYVTYLVLSVSKICKVRAPLQKVCFFNKNCLNFYKKMNSPSIDCKYFYRNYVHFYNNNICALLQKSVFFTQKVYFLYKKCVYFKKNIFAKTYKISPLQYQNAFYGPDQYMC